MNQSIFPERLAAAYVKHAGEKYRPSNGTEGQLFLDAFCRRCERDGNGDDDNGQRCEINGLTMIYQVGEAEYPTEWQHGKDGQPCCTAFIPAGDPIPTPRCTKTLELF